MLTQREIVEHNGSKYIFGELWDGTPLELISILERLFNIIPQAKGMKVRLESMPERGHNYTAITFYKPKRKSKMPTPRSKHP